MRDLWSIGVWLVWACLLAAGSAAAEGPAVPQGPRDDAAVLEAVGAAVTDVLARPRDPQSVAGLLRACGPLAEGNLREAVLFTAAVALAAAGDQANLQALQTQLQASYPASRYRERLDEAARPVGAPCAATCAPECPACHGTGVPGSHPALRAMAEECQYLMRTRVRALMAEAGTADLRDSGRNVTPPELKPALKAFADWMLMQQRRLERRIVARLHATREGRFAVLQMTVTPEFTSQDYEWRLTIAKACVKDWAVKCKDLDASAGLRIYDESGNLVGEYNVRNWQVWLPKDGEPPRPGGAPPAEGTSPAADAPPAEAP